MQANHQTEIWLNYKGNYHISNLGNVKIIKDGVTRPIKIQISHTGYPYFYMNADRIWLGNAMLKVFFKTNSFENKIEYIDGDKKNCSVDNMKIKQKVEDVFVAIPIDIVGEKYQGLYYINNKGVVKRKLKSIKKAGVFGNVETFEFVTPIKRTNRLYVGIADKKISIANIVGKMFVDGYSEDYIIKFYDNNPMNLNYTNLYWAQPSKKLEDKIVYHCDNFGIYQTLDELILGLNESLNIDKTTIHNILSENVFSDLPIKLLYNGVVTKNYQHKHTEIWKDIKEFKNYNSEYSFQVSNMGNVRKIKNHIVTEIDKRRLNINNWQPFVHTIVATLFVENPNKFTHVKHIDGNKSNNKADNLMWVQNVVHDAKYLFKPKQREKVKYFENGIYISQLKKVYLYRNESYETLSIINGLFEVDGIAYNFDEIYNQLFN